VVGVGRGGYKIKTIKMVTTAQLFYGEVRGHEWLGVVEDTVVLKMILPQFTRGLVKRSRLAYTQ
jgi:hypothetical protein